MDSGNTIKCRFCTWRTHKYGNKTTPEKAFARLFRHVEAEHTDEADKFLDRDRDDQ